MDHFLYESLAKTIIVFLIFFIFVFSSSVFGTISEKQPAEELTINNNINDEQPEQPDFQKLPFCGGTDQQRDSSHRLLYVTTLDGKFTAIDMTNGTLKWSIPNNASPLLSSSIHNLELTNNGQWIRMIPSLSGSLYKFDGDTIEPIPVTADQLLSASFKFSDDLVISGGKETRSYGISSRTGKLVYECSFRGCKNTTDNAANDNIQEEEDLLIIRRQTQTVRAVQPRTGTERWNFSVGYHEVEILKSVDCHDRTSSDIDAALQNVDLKVVVPEGIIYAVNKEAPTVILWQYKFDHPIVSAWQNKKDKLEMVNLFSTNQWPTSFNGADEMENNFAEISPSVYIGMFNKQLYIQESAKLMKFIQSSHRDNLKIPWKPYSPTGTSIALIENTDLLYEHDATSPDLTTAITALSHLSPEHINGNGYYLYSSIDLNKTQSGLCDRLNSSGSDSDLDSDGFDGFPFADDDTPGKIIIVSLWFWWKEIMVISLTTALILNVIISRRITTYREVVIVERHVEIKVPTAVLAEPSVEEKNVLRLLSESNNNLDKFVSRFQNDFEMLRCLGKGGFGVVFESKNKLDDCNYAIKRIVLPNRQESRDRVMREVKTLAHCEHKNIVRYFQAWVEAPPPGWQENEDKIWMDREALSHSIDIDSPTNESSRPMPVVEKRILNEIIDKNNQNLDSWISNLNTNECINFDDNNRKTTFSLNDTTCDDSFIQFKNEDDDSVFNKENYSDDSFQIEFKHSTNNDSNSAHLPKDCDSIEQSISNGVSGPGFYNYSNNYSSTTNNDSFQIEFRNSTYDSGSMAARPTTANIIKKRTFSENGGDNFMGKSKFKRFSFTENESSNNCDRTRDGDGDEDQPNNKIIPFKKTHRRPMSLDLSCRKKQIQLLSSNRVYLYIQMQLCKKESLKDWLKSSNANTRYNEVVPIFKQIVDGVEYCHLKGLIHRDLKPSNIFFSLDGQIKIGDFGLVTDGMSDIPNTPCGGGGDRISFVKHTEQVGTHLYMSPEQLHGLQYNYKVDIYSLGLIFFELLVCFGTEMERIETLKKLRINKFPNEFPTSFPDEYNLLKIMLSQNPSERPTTIGIRSRPPLGNESNTMNELHFHLPPRRRDSFLGGLSSSSSSTLDRKSSS